MNDDDRDRPIYSDTGYFTRGRTGYRAEPHVPAITALGWFAVAFAVTTVGVLAAVHFLLPTVQ
jgi:hypothetical protein